MSQVPRRLDKHGGPRTANDIDWPGSDESVRKGRLLDAPWPTSGSLQLQWFAGILPFAGCGSDLRRQTVNYSGTTKYNEDALGTRDQQSDRRAAR